MRTWLGGIGIVAFSMVLAVGCGGGGSKTDPGFQEEPEGVEEDVPVTPDVPQEVPGDVTADADVLPPTDTNDLGPTDVVVTCSKDKDCANAPVTLGACQQKVCLKDTGVCGAGWTQACNLPEGTVLLSQDFEGDLGGWLLEDPNPKDQVTWSITTHRKAEGTKSLYFGDPKCFTYFNGAMDAQCKALDPDGRDSTSVKAMLTSKWIEIPGTQDSFVLGFYAWVDAEPMWAVSDTTFEQPDQLRVLVVKPGATETVDKVFSSVQVKQSTNGLFLYFAADLTQYAGQKIAIRLVFDTLDGTRNQFEGAYVDGIVLKTTAKPTCSPGEACENDTEKCTDDLCQVFTNNASKGACSYPVKPGCVEPQCTETNAAEKCPVADPCKVARCVEGQCSFEDKPEGQCCKTDTLLVRNFDDDTLGGFEVWAYQDNPSVKWQVAGNRASSGKYALYYGDTVKGSYDSGAMNFGTATSPALDLPAKGYPFLSFNLWLSTEFDTVVSTNYYNPLGTDYFQVLIVENLGQAGEKATRVWSSDNVYGTTAGQWIPVGVDLTPFAGKKVGVRFQFDTGDDAANNFEGAYVDDVKVVRDTCVHRNCAAKADCLVDGTCRTGDCTDGQCVVQQVGTPPDCCSVASDCDDKNDCTTDGCLDHKCHNEPVQKPGCCVPLRIGNWEFDDASSLDQIQFVAVDESQPGPGGLEVKWQVSDIQAKTGARSLYFGNGVNFDNGGIAAGTVTTPTFKVSGDGIIRLSMWLWLDIDTDPGKDVFKVDVMDGLVPTPVATKALIPADQYRSWVEIAGVDLSSFHNKTISLRFSFNSVDPGLNTGLGVFVDGITVQKLCP